MATATKAKPKKEEKVSLQEAAEAFLAVHDSGNYSGRRYEHVLSVLREAVEGKNATPIVPEPEEDEEPGPRDEKAEGEIALVLKQAEDAETEEPARKIARQAKEAAEEAEKSEKK